MVLHAVAVWRSSVHRTSSCALIRFNQAPHRHRSGGSCSTFVPVITSSSLQTSIARHGRRRLSSSPSSESSSRRFVSRPENGNCYEGTLTCPASAASRSTVCFHPSSTNTEWCNMYCIELGMVSRLKATTFSTSSSRLTAPHCWNLQQSRNHIICRTTVWSFVIFMMAALSSHHRPTQRLKKDWQDWLWASSTSIAKLHWCSFCRRLLVSNVSDTTSLPPLA